MNTRKKPRTARMGAVMCGAALAVTIFTGCRSTPHAVEKEQAQRRWSEVRGRVKHQLAVQQYEAGLFQEAYRTVTEALALDPSCTAMYELLAKCSLELNKPASAQQAIDLATRADLDSPDLTYLQGVLYEQRGAMDKAIEQYRRALSTDPAQIDFLVALVESLVAVGDTRVARSVLQRGAPLVDDDGSLAVLAAYLALMAGDAAEATAHLQTAAVLDKQSDVVALDLGRLLARSHRCREALDVLQPLIERSKDLPLESTVRRAIAECHVNDGEPSKAKEILVDFAPLHPQDVATQVLLAKAALSDGDLITALSAVTTAERFDPDNAEVRLLRATLLWKRGDAASAESLLNDLVRRSPNDADLRCLLAEVLLDQNKQADARASLERALQIDPEFQWAKDALARLESSS